MVTRKSLPRGVDRDRGRVGEHDHGRRHSSCSTVVACGGRRRRGGASASIAPPAPAAATPTAPLKIFLRLSTGLNRVLASRGLPVHSPSLIGKMTSRGLDPRIVWHRVACFARQLPRTNPSAQGWRSMARLSCWRLADDGMAARDRLGPSASVAPQNRIKHQPPQLPQHGKPCPDWSNKVYQIRRLRHERGLRRNPKIFSAVMGGQRLPIPAPVTSSAP